jgi:hypothetical protein
MANHLITVATPVFGETFFTPYVHSLFQLQKALHQRRWEMAYSTISYAQIAEARNYLLTHWFDKSRSTHLLFVDADMGYEPELILDMIALNKPVVGVICTKRKLSLKRLISLAEKKEKPERAIARAHDFIVRPLRDRRPRTINGFIEVAGCGTGIMLIQRAAISAMLKAIPEINDSIAKTASPFATRVDRMIRAFDPIKVDGLQLADDYAFCHRWQKLCGGELWASTDRKVTHVGLFAYGARFADAQSGPRIAIPKPRPIGKARRLPIRPGQ